MNKSQILDFIAFYKMSQLLWNWGYKLVSENIGNLFTFVN